MRPKTVALDRPNKKLVITWADDTRCEFPLQLLREACPCVECRGGHENMGQKPQMDDLLLTIPLVQTKSYEVAQLTPVGHYALMPEWTDGHKSGMYTWAYLRDLCADLTKALQAKSTTLYKPLGE